MESSVLLELQTELLAELASGNGLKGLTQRMSLFLQKPVLVTDPAYRILACYGSSLNIVEGMLISPCFEENNPQRCRFAIASEHIQTACIYDIYIQRKRQGSLIIPVENFSEDEELKQIGGQLALLCAVEFNKNNSLKTMQRHYQDAFIYDLLYSNIDSLADILLKAEIWGWDLNRPHRVAVFRLGSPDCNPEEKDLLVTLTAIIEDQVAQTEGKPIIMQKGEQIILVLPTDNRKQREQKAQIKTLKAVVDYKAEPLLGKKKLSVGAGRVYDNPTHFFRSYQEAKVALELEEMMDNPNNVAFFSDLGVARILFNHDQSELAEFYQETLGELAEYDLKHSNDLLTTLEKYIANRCELRATADALFLHPNTLRYRLKKVEEILDTDLENTETKLDIMVALKIKRLKKV
ncbi:helix-turn-helix domain-containing protein [Desulfosporosinus sp. PR]|uniref:PucR family transcriptional regulator n=1 Tax=Candidatus Desulfosporosinus nitrosoreducens TaxID=3401928 RepID=UPI0027E70872|nr:helix-turn-helix domain-containing protein [Desulfosporosinus sp. PR]MDQ7093734.1 helix-turn-helix domain-containing protein [Desulfosporosinus sp. PR]